MINRRQVMASGIAATLLARTGVARTDAASKQVFAGRVLFVADAQIPAAQLAARAATTSGADARQFASDLTPVYQWLDLDLRRSPQPVAGLTRTNALFVIERLAWDRGLRTVYRGIHTQGNGNRIAHRLAGSPSISRQVAALDDLNWASDLGKLLGSVPAAANFNDVLTAQRMTSGTDDALVSWLLVPRSELSY